MKTIFINYPEIPQFEPRALCIGNFDGVHTGHQELISRTISIAREEGLISSLLTFWPDPLSVIPPVRHRKLLTDMEQRKQLFEFYGIEELIIVNFIPEFRDLMPDEFLQFLTKLNIKHLICGYDFTFGRYGLGNLNDLYKQHYYIFHEVKEHQYLGEKVSSTRISRDICLGKVEDALIMMDHDYRIKGKVVNGILTSDVNVLPEKGDYEIVYRNRKHRITAVENGFATDLADHRKITFKITGKWKEHA